MVAFDTLAAATNLNLLESIDGDGVPSSVDVDGLLSLPAYANRSAVPV